MVPNWNGPTGARGPRIDAKLEAFQRIEDEFRRCFRFVQDVHGQRRFETFTITDTVRYLHSLWICECKDHLLSVPKTIRRYEGVLCLELLAGWQRGQSANVVAFLHRKLDMLPLTEVTIQIEQAHAAANERLVRRLMHGRGTMLNRTFTLYRAFDAIFGSEPHALMAEVTAICRDFGHTPEGISAQLAQVTSPVFAFVLHPDLARRNMLVMNALGVAISDNAADRPGDRTPLVEAGMRPVAPYAQVMIPGEMTLTSMAWNNPQQLNLANADVAVDAPRWLGSNPRVSPASTVPEPRMGPPFAR
ncbi:MAG: hypothetical protein ACHQ4H_01410 [Ktedonobacterales bacterium]